MNIKKKLSKSTKEFVVPSGWKELSETSDKKISKI